MAAPKTESRQTDKSKDNKTNPGTQKDNKLRKRVSYKAKYEEIKIERDQCDDRLMRLLAEFDNMKRRSERERAELIESASSGLILQILPVLDDLERSLKIKHKGDELRQGIELIHKKLTRLLEDRGVTSIESSGTPFDVKYHDALLLVENPEIESGIVIEEHEKGYRMHDKVLRHAKVIVSK